LSFTYGSSNVGSKAIGQRLIKEQTNRLALQLPRIVLIARMTGSARNALAIKIRVSYAAGLFPFLSPEHHNYPNYYHHRNPRSPDLP
jgi:hypothetical protein